MSKEGSRRDFIKLVGGAGIVAFTMARPQSTGAYHTHKYETPKIPFTYSPELAGEAVGTLSGALGGVKNSNFFLEGAPVPTTNRRVVVTTVLLTTPTMIIGNRLGRFVGRHLSSKS